MIKPTGSNTEQNSLFAPYANGTAWADYRNVTFDPVKYSANLSVLFPDETTRQNAIATCFSESRTDPDPGARRECYYDFRVTLDPAFARDTKTATQQLTEYVELVGRSDHREVNV